MFGGSRLDKKIDTYIHKIVNQLNCDEEEKRELIDEMRDHLHLLKNEYLDEGLTEEKATQKALESFGEQKELTKGLQDSLFPYYKVFKIGTWILFVLYSFVVLFKLLFERIIVRIFDSIHGMDWNRYIIPPENSEGIIEFLKFNTNIIPFKNTIKYIIGSDHFNLDIIINNTLGNILIFLPLGIFLPLLFKKYSRVSKIIVTSIVISFSIETIQLVLKIGQFDIDDVILNMIGSIFGFWLLRILKNVIILPKRGYFRRSTN